MLVDDVVLDQHVRRRLDARCAVVVHAVAAHGRGARGGRPADGDAAGGVPPDVVAFHQAARRTHEHAVRVAVELGAEDARAIAAVLDVDAVLRVAVDPAVREGEAIGVGVGVRVDAVVPARHGNVVQRHVVRAGQLHDVGVAVRVATIEDRLMGRIDRPLDAHPRILDAQHDVGGEVVDPGVDVDHVVRVEVVRAQQRRTGSPSAHPRVLPELALLPDRGGVLVAGERGVVHVVGRAAIGDQEGRVGDVLHADRPRACAVARISASLPAAPRPAVHSELPLP